MRILASLLLAVLVTALAITSVLLTNRPVAIKQSGPVQLTGGETIAVDPSFSPDGRRMAYSSNASGTYQIWMMDVTGRHRVQLTTTTGDQMDSQWSADGKYIAFLSFAGGSTEILAIDLNSMALKTVSGNTYSNRTSFDWCPSQPMIVYDAVQGGKWNIYTANLTNGKVIQLTQGEGDNRDPSWTSDGQRILFSSNRVGAFKIFEMSPTGLETRQLTAGSGDDLEPIMSPNGGLIAYTSNEYGVRTPWLISDNGSGNHPVQSNPPVQKPGLGYSPEVSSDTRLAWRFDSKALLFEGSGGNVFTFYLNTTVLRYNGAFRGAALLGDALIITLAGPFVHMQPVWAPDGNSFAFVSSTAGGLQICLDVFVAKSPNPYA